MRPAISFDDDDNTGVDPAMALQPQYASPQMANGYLPLDQTLHGQNQQFYNQQMANGYSPMNQTLYGQNQQFYNQRSLELAVKAEKAVSKIETVKETERIHTLGACERKARILDLQVLHENRKIEVIRGGDGNPVLRSEMLRENDWLKPIADISQCSAVLYTPDIYKPNDRIRRIIEVRFYNNFMCKERSFYYNLTEPDEKSFYKCLMANQVKLFGGRRKSLEYAGKLLEWFEEIATEIVIPRERGFFFLAGSNTLCVNYFSEKDITWEVVMGLCV